MTETAEPCVRACTRTNAIRAGVWSGRRGGDTGLCAAGRRNSAVDRGREFGKVTPQGVECPFSDDAIIIWGLDENIETT